MLRNDASVDVPRVWRDSPDLVGNAGRGGMVTACVAERPGLEFRHVPDPLTILADWTARTTRIRPDVGGAPASIRRLAEGRA